MCGLVSREQHAYDEDGKDSGQDVQVVLARLRRAVTQGALEELDVVGLVGRDLREAVADPEREAGLLEVALAVLGEAAGVERVLEVLECEREAEDTWLSGLMSVLLS